MNILIPIETSSREVLYKTYLSHLLALKGFNCFLGEKPQIFYLMEKMRSYIYLDKGYHKGVSEKLYEIIKRQNGIIISLDEEGGIDYPDNSTLNSRYSKKLFSEAQLVFMWGKNQIEIIYDNIRSLNKVEVTGHPRFELLKSKYHLFYNDQVNKIINKHGNFVLINTNMGFGNNIKGDEFVIKNYGTRFTNIHDKVNFDKVKREMFISLAKKIADNSKDKVIFRPHPEEDQEYYINAFRKHKNINVIYEGSVIAWLLAANIMIHPDCTTSIESLLLGKKAISFLPDKYDINLVTKIPVEVSHRFSNENDIINFLEKKNYQTSGSDYRDLDIVEKYFSFSKDSSELIANKIAHFFNSSSLQISNNIKFKEKIILGIKSFKAKLAWNPSVKLSRNKLKGFTSKEIKYIHSNIVSIDKKFNNIKIKRVSEKLFLFKL